MLNMFFILNQTAEIIALLYEATQGPPLPLDEPPALNPTGTSFTTIIRASLIVKQVESRANHHLH